MHNRRSVKLAKLRQANGEYILAEGWVGVTMEAFHDIERVGVGALLFRPTRGSGGFALYSTEAQALRLTGAPRALKVQLRLDY